MSIGIIGAGALGSNLARLLAKSRIEATIANRRGPSSLAGLVKDLSPSIKAGTTEDAAKADMVILAVRWADLKTALGALPAWNGRVVIDSTNPVEFLAPDSPDRKDPSNPLAAYGLKAVDLGGKVSTRGWSAGSFLERGSSRRSTISPSICCRSQWHPAASACCSIRATMPVRKKTSASSSTGQVRSPSI